MTLDELRADPVEFERSLVPMLRADAAPGPGEIDAWSHELVDGCQQELQRLLPLNAREIASLDALNDGGEVRPALLIDDASVQERIAGHPGLQWKALNVRRKSGGGSDR